MTDSSATDVLTENPENEETEEAPVESSSSSDGGGSVLSVTPPASAKIAELLSQEVDADRLALRVAVRPGGCSGFSYDMFFDSDIATDDSVDVVAEAVRVVVDATSAQMLAGATLDYSDGLQGAGFNIINPNASKSCGCGKSFS